MSRNHARLHAGRWSRVRRQILVRDNFRCQACGHPGGPFEVDHIVPLTREPAQNPYDPAGLQTLCRRPCHAAKTASENRRELSPDEAAWRRYLEAAVRE